MLLEWKSELLSFQTRRILGTRSAFLINPSFPFLPNGHSIFRNILIIPTIFPMPILPTVYNARANKLELSAEP